MGARTAHWREGRARTETRAAVKVRPRLFVKTKQVENNKPSMFGCDCSSTQKILRLSPLFYLSPRLHAFKEDASFASDGNGECARLVPTIIP